MSLLTCRNLIFEGIFFFRDYVGLKDASLTLSFGTRSCLIFFLNLILLASVFPLTGLFSNFRKRSLSFNVSVDVQREGLLF